jgi:putative glutamine amidotransferase
VHWQAINRLGEGLVVEGHAPDGVIEAVRVQGKRFALGVQWHPEYRCTENADSMRLFRAFGEAVRSYAAERRGKLQRKSGAAA